MATDGQNGDCTFAGSVWRIAAISTMSSGLNILRGDIGERDPARGDFDRFLSKATTWLVGGFSRLILRLGFRLVL